VHDSSMLSVQSVGYKLDDPKFDFGKDEIIFSIQETTASLKVTGT
jgi:hypothetical protein